MIELPEAYTIATQMTAALRGKRIAGVVRGNVPHKFAFYNHSEEEYRALLNGRRLESARGNGSFILLGVDSGQFLLFGDGGERILLHASEASLPKKHHFLLRFEDGASLTVTVQGWGFAMLIDPAEFPPPYYREKNRVSPLSAEFNFEFFESLFEELGPDSACSAKYFLVSKPGVWGMGNGCLQDILFQARLHPRRRVVELSPQERRGLYEAIRGMLAEMVRLGGRDSETDLFGQPGGYRRIMHNEAVGEPCPACGSSIEKAAYLGGAVYYCPNCQK